MSAEPTFVARQPILDQGGGVYGYELLFRRSSTSESCDMVAEVASATVITNAVVGIGLDTLTQGRRAFVNVGRRMLLEGISEVLPAERVVIELTEDIEADADTIDACQRLRRAGYTLALDDFVLNERTEALVPYADFIKVDFLGTSDPDERARVASRRVKGRPQLIAEKIESSDLYDRARAEGYTYFQGFYFGKPLTRPGEPLPGHHLGYLRLLHALQDPNLSADQLETLVKPDPRLCYMILRTVNSAGFAMRRTVHSIREGLVLLGSDAVRRWASLWVLADLGRQGHPELVAMSATRARCCELIAAQSGDRNAAGDGFIVGMCSLLDSILARPMDEILEHLPISDAAKGALLGEDNAQRQALEATIAYERGDWDAYLKTASRAQLEPSLLPQVHSDALRWSSQLRRAAAPSSEPVKTEAAPRR